MLKLSSPSAAPEWIDLLPGVRLRVRMVDTLTVLAARRAARRVYVEAEEAGPPKGDIEVSARATVALTVSIAHAVITEWSGIGDADGNEAAVTPENVDALMARIPAFEAFDRIVVAKGFGEAAAQS